MKIIGESNDELYIVQLTKDELANILGFYSKYDIDFNKIIKASMKNGSNTPISAVYRNYHNVKGIVDSPHYDMARTKLQDMLKAIEPIEELIIKLKDIYETDKTKF